jgi:hypothetical protein
MSEGKWKEASQSPNLEETQIGNLAKQLGLLKSYFESELAKEVEKLSYLESKKQVLEVQKRKQRKANEDGGSRP